MKIQTKFAPDAVRTVRRGKFALLNAKLTMVLTHNLAITLQDIRPTGLKP